ncbi:ABC transporter permease [Hymenobacter sp. BT523]|uniref:ABC transporter permease/M1 family aminopeptidase n=1 Tax=Hymenobacter sp. BT523 TaxID=2795725 RepID=UPI0018EDA70B|nr:ABC transporter permease [Hymenobacter sp. BT523]MBJ6110323.1 ABC transporter permease [Hymenobacter sp. BT523]
MRKLWEVCRFEFVYQAGRVSTWFYFLLLLGLSFLLARQVFVNEAQVGGYFLNAPFAVAQVTLVASMLGLLPLAAFAGGAAARDVETRMHPILYTAPIGKGAYLGGRLLAAFALSALLMSTIPAGLLAAAFLPGAHGDLIGPMRPAAYLSAYFLLALPNAFIAMAFMFSAAAFSRRGVVSYLGGVFVFFAAVVSWQFVAVSQGNWALGKLTDPLGLTGLGELSELWSASEKNTLQVGLQPAMLANRLLWLGVALGVLALTYFRFRLAHLAEGSQRGRAAQSPKGPAALPAGIQTARIPQLTVPPVQPAFGPGARVVQAFTMAKESFQLIVTGWGSIGAAILAAFVFLTGPLWFSEYYDVPELPATGKGVNILENTGDHGLWLVIPLLIVYYAGELVWREREAGLGGIAGAAPVPVWVSFAGKFTGLGLALIAVQALLIATAMLVQVRLGYYHFELGLYAQILLGLRLTDYLLFAVLAFTVHVVVDQKYVAHLLAILAYVAVAFGSQLGLEPGLLAYGSDPGWSYSDMRGLEPYLGPWLLFKGYWAAWALLLAVLTQLFWARGGERGLGPRLRGARRRLSRRIAAILAASVALIITGGGLLFYNLNVPGTKPATSDTEAWRADYERKYGRYAGIPQPRIISANLRVEIYPKRRAVEARGTCRLVNNTRSAIDSVHVATAPGVETRSVGFDVPARPAMADDALGHHIYALKKPLLPGDSLQLTFDVRFAPQGFAPNQLDASVVPNGTYVDGWWLPSVGYQRSREFRDARQRRSHGLAPRPAVTPLDDPMALRDVAGQEQIMLDAVVGTDVGQTAVAPGTLRQTWARGGRRYFHYGTDAPIKNSVAFFSAAYAVRQGKWKDTEIQILHHPGHRLNVERMLRAAQAALGYLSRQFGSYPHRQLRLVEVPGDSKTLFAHPTNISYEEGFALLDPDKDPRGVDLPSATVAHEVAHHWWGHQLAPAQVGGAALLTESLAWYSALEVVEAAQGPAKLRQLLGMVREDFLGGRARAAEPLLRATDRVQYYRKGPLALFALREYAGKDQVHTALRRLLEKQALGRTPLPTPLDLYRELRAATPDSLHYLLHDLFAANTFWELETKNVTTRKTAAGTWQVTLDVQARKVVIEANGLETEVPMNDWVQLGLFASAKEENESAGLLYLRQHRIRSGRQQLTVTVPRKPARAGIDPNHLLFDGGMDNNIAAVQAEQ